MDIPANSSATTGAQQRADRRKHHQPAAQTAGCPHSRSAAAGRDIEPDLFTADYFNKAHQVAARLRTQAPVCLARMVNGTRVWVINRYEDARHALANPQLAKDATQLGAIARRQLAAAGEETELSALFAGHMLFADGPAHTRLRKHVTTALTPARMRRLAPRIEDLAEQLLDRLPVDPPVDLLASYAFPLPVTVICELLGIPEGERTQFRAWTSALMDDRPEITLPASRAMEAYFRDLIPRKQAQPDNDLLTHLARTSEGEGALTAEELIGTLFLLLVAGHETTTNLIGNAVRFLHTRSDLWRAIADDADVAERAVEEVLRYDGPVRMATYRYTIEPVTYSETTIPAGELVYVSLLAANRDDQFFTDPNRFNPDRNFTQHLAFGHGPHYCLGASLGRLEAAIAVRHLARRFPALRLACDPATLTHQPSAIMNGYTTLPVLLS
ncbi:MULTISPECIES: cytochrome P450 [unclassified Crossiella]|uniref:cytochrome P450 family protein n=1 Tax=unclassified Crossiella TaxID=2620835 RepID=UPI001FFFF2C8|nr:MULTISPECIES: cytochrome P450 [unclassified Crossiella]MCK2239970.1 cytochrome P450 [Crossiella sp. S99.2]MCK2252678.1 cytochrome P450 [Crossiella sp. S99.1]